MLYETRSGNRLFETGRKGTEKPRPVILVIGEGANHFTRGRVRSPRSELEDGGDVHAVIERFVTSVGQP